MKSKKAKKPKPARPKLLRIPEEMREWSALLEGEVRGWPRVTSRPMFGFMGLYCGRRIFAALPRTRALSSPTSFILKFDPLPPKLLANLGRESRIKSESDAPGAHWYAFELRSAADLNDALAWLNRAYEAAKS